MTLPTHHNYEAVLQHLTWVQRLAHRLCADAAQAEDVCQESLLAAFRTPHRRGPALRQWLVGVVRNQARLARRSAGRRRRHEAAGERSESSPAAADLVERVATQRTVVEAVLALPEPYRTALLRRYFDDLGPKDIAAMQGVPEATVKTRLRRGLELLRERLTIVFGDEERPRGLYVALVPLANMELQRLAVAGSAAPSASGGASVSTISGPVGYAAVALLIGSTIGLGLWVRLGWGSTAQLRSERDTTQAIAGQPDAAFQRRPSGAALPSSAGERVGSSAERGVDIVTPALPTPEAAAAMESLLVGVRVQDVEGQPVADLELVRTGFADGSVPQRTIVGRTNSDGWLEYRQAPELGRLLSRSTEWCTVLPGTVFPYGDATSASVVVARPRRVHGVVTTKSGTAIAGARIVYTTALDLRTRLLIPVDQAALLEWPAISDAAGAFTFDGVPELPGASLSIEAWGHETANVSLDPRGEASQVCALEPLASSSTWIEGWVRLGNGEPAAGAALSLGTYAVRASTDGRFRIDASRDAAATELWAAVVGLAPIRTVRPASGWPRHLELQLAGESLTLSGRVLDAQGNARSGIEVDLADPTRFGFLPVAGEAFFAATTLEGFCVNGRTRVRTGADGRFQLHGLLDRSYRLVLRDSAKLQITVLDPLPAGANDLTVTLPRHRGTHSGSRLHGRHQGRPAAARPCLPQQDRW